MWLQYVDQELRLVIRDDFSPRAQVRLKVIDVQSQQCSILGQMQRHQLYLVAAEGVFWDCKQKRTDAHMS
jgi:hypothetical protein